MIRRQFAALLLLFALLVPFATFAQQPEGLQQPQLDPNDPIAKIRDEGLNRSQVMQTLSYLSDVIGPRLTASPGMKRANEWTRDTLAKWGLQNAHLEAWGPFGRGWSLKRFSAQVTDPLDFPLIAYPKAWSPGTNGPVTADVVYFDAKDEADMVRFKGQLKGKIVLTQQIAKLRHTLKHRVRASMRSACWRSRIHRCPGRKVVVDLAAHAMRTSSRRRNSPPRRTSSWLTKARPW